MNELEEQVNFLINHNIIILINNQWELHPDIQKELKYKTYKIPSLISFIQHEEIENIKTVEELLDELNYNYNWNLNEKDYQKYYNYLEDLVNSNIPISWLETTIKKLITEKKYTIILDPFIDYLRSLYKL